MSLLQVTDLTVAFPTDTERVNAVRGMNFHLDPGEVVALVGESGSGKSASAMAIIGLLPEYAEVSGSIRLHGDERPVHARPDHAHQRERGRLHDRAGDDERRQGAARERRFLVLVHEHGRRRLVRNDHACSGDGRGSHPADGGRSAVAPPQGGPTTPGPP